MSSVYRPSARVQLKLRLDEGADQGNLADKLNRPPPSAGGGAPGDIVGALAGGLDSGLDGNRAARRAVGSVRGKLSGEELGNLNARLDEERTAVQLGGPEQERPAALEPVHGDQYVVLGGIMPISCSIERNGILEADTAEIVIDYSDAPFDPRIVRAAFVEIVIGTVASEDYELGIQGARRPDGSLLSLVEWSDGQDVRFGTTTRFVGYVDEWDIHADGSSGDTVTLRCRDVTAALLAKRVDEGDEIDLTKPIADGVQELIDRYASTEGILVVYGHPTREKPSRTGDRGPVPTVPATLKARRGKKVRRARQGARDLKVWDHLTDVCVSSGVMPILRGYTLYLAKLKTFYSDLGRSKKLVYGRNLSSLSFSRKLDGSVKVPTVEVRCSDPSIGKTRWARAPKPAGGNASGVYGEKDPPAGSTRVAGVTPGGKPLEEITVHRITGVASGEQLEAIAENLFESAARQEVEGSFETSDITAFESEEDGDLLDLQPGDPVEVLIAPLNAATSGDSTNTSGEGSVNTLQQLGSMSVARRAAYLQSRGWGEKQSRRLAEANELLALITSFRTQTVNVDWSAADGLKITGDFVNFLVVRESPAAAPGAASLGADLASGGRTSAMAGAVRDRSAASDALGKLAAAGELAPAEYASQGGAAVGGETRAVQTNRRTG